MATKELSKADAKAQRKVERKKLINEKVQKRVEKIMAEFHAIVGQLEVLRDDIQSVNVRMQPFQPHIKDKWLNELARLIEMAKTIKTPQDKEVEVSTKR